MESTDYLFQQVSVTVLTCMKEPRNKKGKQFSLDKKSLYASGNKVFLPRNGLSLISETVFTCGKKNQIRENGFHRTENVSPPYGLEDWFKNTLPLDGK